MTGPLERVTVGFNAESAADAVILAKAWARNEPLRILTICSVRRVDGTHSTWRVELAVRWDAITQVRLPASPFQADVLRGERGKHDGEIVEGVAEVPA